MSIKDSFFYIILVNAFNCRFQIWIADAFTRYTVQTAINYVCGYNIRDYLALGSDDEAGEPELVRTISEFSCPQNPDLERFLKNSAPDRPHHVQMNRMSWYSF